MDRKQKDVRKIGNHTEEQVKKALKLVKVGVSARNSAKTAGILSTQLYVDTGRSQRLQESL